MKSSTPAGAPTGAPAGRHSAAPVAASQYCAICGEDAAAHGTPLQRFGEALCSEAHAEQFVAKISADRAAAASAGDPTPANTAQVGAAAADTGAGGASWRQWGMRALCWGGPVLAIVLLTGGGSSLLGAAGSVLPYLLLLACPVAMVLMMKGMGGMQRPASPPDAAEAASRAEAAKAPASADSGPKS